MSARVADIACITQATLERIHHALLTNKRRLVNSKKKAKYLKVVILRAQFVLNSFNSACAGFHKNEFEVIH